MTLAEAAKLAPGHPSASAIWRWCRKGVKARDGTAVFLKHVRVGRQVYTTAAWLHGFFEQVATADQNHFAAGASLTAQASDARFAEPQALPPTLSDASDGVPTRHEDLEAALREEGL